MKTLSKRALSLLLAALLLLSALPTATAAEDDIEAPEEALLEAVSEELTCEPEAEDESEPEAISQTASLKALPEEELLPEGEEPADEDNSIPNGSWTELETLVYVNPIYADVITEEELLAETFHSDISALSVGEQASYLASSPYGDVTLHTTFDSAAEELRQSFGTQEEEINIYFYSANSLEDLNAAFKAIYAKAIAYTGNPTEGDYIQYEYGGYSGSIIGQSNSSGYYYNFIIYPLYYSNAAQEAALNVKAAQILAQLNLNGLSDYEKVRLIYQYLVNHVTYDNANLNNDSYKLKYTAYAALINGTAVCQGYSCAFYRLAVAAGVESRIIGSKSMCHAWNLTLLNGTPYMLDSTWEAGFSEQYWRYFLRGSTYWLFNHKGDEYDPKTGERIGSNYSDLGDEFQIGGRLAGVYTLPEADFASPVWTLIYDANGGTAVPAAQAFAATPKTSGTNKLYQAPASATVTTEAPVGGTDNGTFLGWAESPSAASAAIAPGQTLNLTDSKTLYAVWQSDTPLASGTLENGVSWKIGADGCLTFSGTGPVEEEWASAEDVPWCSYRESITAVSVPDTVDTIGDYAFSGCTALEIVTLPDTLESLGAYAFAGCTSLQEIVLPSALESVNEGTFSGCTALTTVVLPEGLKTLWGGAFEDCSSLTELALPAGLQNLDPSAFAGCTGVELTFPEDSSYQTVDGVLYGNNGATLLRYSDTTADSFRLPNEVTAIGTNAFSGLTLTVISCNSALWENGVAEEHYGGSLTWVFAHDYTVETTKAATCTEAGESLSRCKICLSEETTAIPAIGHAYQAQVTAPTCTEGGFTLYVCSNCYDSYSAEETEPLGHDVVRGACTRCSYTEYCLVLTAPETLVAKKSVALKAELLPYNMTRTSFVWSITEGAEYATLSSSGKLTAKAVTEQHTVTVRVATKDGAVEPVECTVTLLPKVTSVRILQDGEPVTGLTLDYNLRDEASVPIVLTADAFPTDATQTIQWTCSDKKSAYCCWELAEDGSLTVVPSGTGKVGTVTFTAAATDGSGKKAKVKVKFSNIALEGDLAITNTINRVTSGKKLKLTYAFTPIKPTVNKLVWSIDPEGAAYASVSSSGVVTAKKGLGTAEDGSYYRVTVTAALKSNPAVRASIELEIIPAVTAVTILAGEGEEAQVVSGTKLTVNCGDTLKLSAIATPEAATQTVTWKSSYTKRATVTADGMVTFLAKGTVKITATAADGTAKKSYVTLVVQ